VSGQRHPQTLNPKLITNTAISPNRSHIYIKQDELNSSSSENSELNG